ncbi:hypothetical protein BD324DRAFT_631223 [Kockovaella imperatae]|uniref:Uncharacterized protein n=1 Tax=Kockovaella imperatae TaxID=4999 RepID=A0A1Y1UCC3_9TREE|nr:hypothetical protein BD324DRAFT_631223 [Kockovaella imperatae]ORX35693.1 hypothetical protein BD324DRAFT_631223 [Kockovaella imperatae]
MAYVNTHWLRGRGWRIDAASRGKRERSTRTVPCMSSRHKERAGTVTVCRHSTALNASFGAKDS